MKRSIYSQMQLTMDGSMSNPNTYKLVVGWRKRKIFCQLQQTIKGRSLVVLGRNEHDRKNFAAYETINDWSGAGRLVVCKDPR